MKILCATNMPYVEEAFGTLGETRVLEGRAIGPGDVHDADLLALRSTTKVGRELLEGSRVRFVGTATIGTDHMDTAWMEANGIRWCSAAGCNANSVSEYFTTALLCLAVRHGFPVAGRTLGVIGVGNVGSRVAAKGRALGMRVLLNDPPQAEALAAGAPSRWGYAARDFVGLAELLRQSDVVTLHVPLTKEGPHPTRHLAGPVFFAQLKPGAIFFNCARGGAMDTVAVLAALDSGRVAHAVIDTWEGEPVASPELAARADIATPHIAGHSFEGRAMGTVLVYEQACAFLGVKPTWSIEGRWPPPVVPEIRLAERTRTLEAALLGVVKQVYDIEGDDRRFRASLAGDAEARGRAFDRLRKDYPMRREFRFTRITGAGDSGTGRVLRELGFQMVS